MTRAAWERTITDSAGNVLTGVQIAVFQQDGITPATIYGQLSGGAALTNPYNTGVQTSAKFYADPGRYVIRATKDSLTKEFTDVDIADKAIRDDVGTAAYLTATTSTTDATQGRAQRVGDFGIGASGNTPVFSGDITTLSATQVVSGGPTTIGGPALATLDGAKIVHIKWADPNSATQIVYTYSGPAYERNIVTGTPGPWRMVYTSANALGAVAFTSGANSGAIIERGSNANGEYVKFADGTMLCAITYVEAANLSTAAGAIFRTADLTWNFPAAFISGSAPAIVGNYAPSRAWLGVVGAGPTQVIFNWLSSAVYNAAGNFAILSAFGRWR